ncbi:hypothetical protein ECG_02748 [Echinococcus granulosus]|uniref:Expressed conserved protein n=1 Tax=Echinococcus granulosus TaxID=6210 RepID=A0A068WPB7_ECHGR|nr:hypothetical protein ECG_02748 [Echinococcus granulosus]CDS20289.1 expressed conserved protein [Echinococcus granulosus]
MLIFQFIVLEIISPSKYAGHSLLKFVCNLVKESLIPPLDFVVPVSASKIPFNNEFVQCTAKHPIVKTVISKEQPSWIEPHFDSSRQRQPHPRAVSAFNGKGSSFKNKGVVGPLNFSSNGQALQKAQNESPKVKPQCPLVPPVTPPPVLHSGQMLVCETPQR